MKTSKPYISLWDGAVDPFRARGLWVSAAHKKELGLGSCLRVVILNRTDATLKSKLINLSTTGSHDISLH
jgi:hypothetical protein